MEIYLIRHTTPSVEKGICYGHQDLDVANTFAEEAVCIKAQLPLDIDAVYSSPLKRCRLLTELLFPNHTIVFDDRLKELNFGDWEGLSWDAIDKEALEKWMADFVIVAPPNGESHQALYNRVLQFFDAVQGKRNRVAVVTHGGVIRSLLAHIATVPLAQSFENFNVPYGCVVCLQQVNGQYSYRIV